MATRARTSSRGAARRSNLVALGLTSLVVAGVLSLEGGRRKTPASDSRLATALREPTQIRSAATADAPIIGTIGQGSRFLVGSEVSGWFPIVREWVNEDGSRTARDLGWVRRSDIAFADATPSPPQIAAASFGAGPKLGNTDGGECTDGWVKFSFPDGIDDFKLRLDTLFSATDRTIRDCASMPVSQKEEWATFLAAWREFASRPSPFLTASAHWQNACGYSRTLDGWRDVVAQTDCKVVGPTTVRGYEVPESASKALDNLATIVKWTAIGGGGAALLAAFYPEIRAGLGAVRRVTRR